MAPVDRITLDREVFKALASDTRLDILKALDERQKTVTELAKQLDLNKATVFEHLEKLAAVNLIQKLEDERKWVYWQLTWTGRRLLHPETITLALALSSAVASALTALVAAFLWMRSNIAAPFEAFDAGEGSTQTTRSLAAPEMAPPPVEQVVQHDPVFLSIAVVLGIAFVGLAVFAWRVRAQARAAAAASGASS
jgi:ArsR family transcriptional regulator, arsenate/arsenite/antimonite-responsive transcriptional repressor